MNAMISSAVLLLAAGPLLPAQETEIHCTDGSRIRGSLLGIGTDRVEFGADFLAAPVPLRLDQILDLTLPIHPGQADGDHIATVTLSNGDVLRGELNGVDEAEIRLKTWYAGDMVFNRKMVDTLEIQDRPEVFYTGPSSLDGWVLHEEDAWSYENGSLRSNSGGSIARDVKLPEKSRIAFDLAWRSNPNLRVLFYSDDVDEVSPSNCYELSCQGRHVQMQKRWLKDDRGGTSSMGDYANVPEFQNKEKCRIELLIDRKTGVVRMLVNDRIVGRDWRDDSPELGKLGGGIHFRSLDSSPLGISRIEVTSWDGMLEGTPAPQDEGFMDEEDTPAPPPDAEPDPTRIRLRNNDQIAGEMVAIEDGKVKLKTTFGDVTLPVSRLRTFALRTKEARDLANWEMGLYEIPKRYNGDVRGWFPDGGSVTFRLTKVEDGKLTGTSQTFGSAVFDQKAFSRIEFNIHEPDLEKVRSALAGFR
jgi:hypothetical protein